MNKVILIGRCGRDPETKHLENDKQVTNFSIATTERYKNKQWEVVENTEWHNCVAWGKTSELIEKFVKKGDKIGVVGKLATRSWDDSNGNKKYATEIIVSEIEFLGGRKTEGATDVNKNIDNSEEDEESLLPF